MQQTYSAVWWLEKLIVSRKIKSVLELGSGHGALTTYFSAMCPDNVVSVDLDIDKHPMMEVASRLGAVQVEADVLNAPDYIMSKAPSARPLMILCDNGNKQEEFPIYVRYLESGDAIAVHDCGTQFDPSHPTVLEAEENCGLIRWYPEQLTEDQTYLAVWIKK